MSAKITYSVIFYQIADLPSYPLYTLIIVSGKVGESVGTTEELMILQKVQDMMLYAYPVLAQFPKSEKFSMAADIKRCMDQALERTLEASKKYYKKTTLQDLDIEVAKLKIYIRLAYNLRFIDMHKYEVWSGKVTEIGKMLGGWLKSVSGRNQT